MLSCTQMDKLCDMHIFTTSELCDVLQAKLQLLAAIAPSTKQQLDERQSEVQHARQLVVELLRAEDAVHHAVQLEQLLGYFLPEAATAPLSALSADLQAWLDAGQCQAMAQFLGKSFEPSVYPAYPSQHHPSHAMLP